MRDSRGRRRNSSRITSCQRSLTSLDFVKKRWPPRSKRYPSRTSVLAMPPTWDSASKTMTGRPRLASRYPAVSPAGPPPSTATGRLGLTPSARRSGPPAPSDRRSNSDVSDWNVVMAKASSAGGGTVRRRGRGGLPYRLPNEDHCADGVRSGGGLAGRFDVHYPEPPVVAHPLLPGGRPL